VKCRQSDDRAVNCKCLVWKKTQVRLQSSLFIGKTPSGLPPAIASAASLWAFIRSLIQRTNALAPGSVPRKSSRQSSNKMQTCRRKESEFERTPECTFTGDVPATDSSREAELWSAAVNIERRKKILAAGAGGRCAISGCHSRQAGGWMCNRL